MCAVVVSVNGAEWGIGLQLPAGNLVRVGRTYFADGLLDIRLLFCQRHLAAIDVVDPVWVEPLGDDTVRGYVRRPYPLKDVGVARIILRESEKEVRELVPIYGSGIEVVGRVGCHRTAAKGQWAAEEVPHLIMAQEASCVLWAVLSELKDVIAIGVIHGNSEGVESNGLQDGIEEPKAGHGEPIGFFADGAFGVVGDDGDAVAKQTFDGGAVMGEEAVEEVDGWLGVVHRVILPGA